MKSIAEIQHSDLLWVDILLIQSRIHLLTQDGNIIDVLKLLDEAEKIASKSALVGYLEKIQEQREILGKNKHLWDGLHQLSSPDRLHIAKTSNYLGSIQEQMSDASLSISEETPQLLIILNSGGLIRYSHSFEEFESDRVELIGSFITALNSFSMDVFASKLPLQKIQHYDYTIVFVQEKTLLFAYIYKGDSPYAGLRLANFVNYVLADPSLKELSDNRLVVKELDKETKERLRFLFSGK